MYMFCLNSFYRVLQECLEYREWLLVPAQEFGRRRCSSMPALLPIHASEALDTPERCSNSPLGAGANGCHFDLNACRARCDAARATICHRISARCRE